VALSSELKEEILSLIICLSGIVILLACFTGGMISTKVEMEILFISFFLLFSFIKPHSSFGVVIIIITIASSVFGSRVISVTDMAVPFELIVYWVVGGFVNKAFNNDESSGNYMRFLGYQLFTSVTGNTIWLVVAILIRLVVMKDFETLDLVLYLVQRLMIIVLHMIVCNKPLTDYFVNRESKD